MRDGFRTCLVVFRIVTGVVVRVVTGVDVGVIAPESSPEEMRFTTTLLPGSSPEESALTSMRVDCFFLRIQEKFLPLHGGRRWSPTSSPGPTKNCPLP
jgi:hypothetical protein